MRDGGYGALASFISLVWTGLLVAGLLWLAQNAGTISWPAWLLP